jgi:transposase
MDTTTTPLASIGVDFAKEVFHVVGIGTPMGGSAFRREIKRLALIETFQKLPPCIVAMEACLSAHSSAVPCGDSATIRSSIRRSM